MLIDRRYTHFVLIFITLGWCYLVLGRKAFVVVLKSVECRANNEYYFMNCSLDNSTNPYLNVEYRVTKRIDEFFAKFVVVLVRNSNDKFTILNSTAIDVCKSRNRKGLETLAFILIDELRKFGNFTMDCPLEVGSYYTSNFQMNPEVLAPYFPDAHFIIELQLFVLSNKKFEQFHHFIGEGVIQRRRLQLG